MARRCFWRNLSKWGAAGQVAKSAALLTAFVEEPTDAEGRIAANRYERQRLNRARNESLKADLAAHGLSYYPVIGAGQTQRRILGIPFVTASDEESFVVQPRGTMEDDQFQNIIRQLLAKYEQYAAAVRLKSNPVAFLLLQDGEPIPLGTSAEPRMPGEPYYTALGCGPRATDAMLDTWELRGERNPFLRVINWFRGRSNLNAPRQDRGGRRYVIKNPRAVPKEGDADVQEL